MKITEKRKAEFTRQNVLDALREKYPSVGKARSVSFKGNPFLAA